MKKVSSLFIALIGFVSTVPQLAFAQQPDVQGVFGIILNLLNGALTILILAAVVFFVYAVVKYIFGNGDKQQIINGLIGLFVIVAFWGIIRIVQNTFELDGPNQLQQQNIPCVQNINC